MDQCKTWEKSCQTFGHNGTHNKRTHSNPSLQRKVKTVENVVSQRSNLVSGLILLGNKVLFVCVLSNIKNNYKYVYRFLLFFVRNHTNRNGIKNYEGSLVLAYGTL